MINFGTVRPGRTLYIPFETFSGSTGAPITMTNFAVGDIFIYKDGGTTERASTSGFTLLDTDGIDFDGITGLHGFSINLADNTTADFYQAGSSYTVVIWTVTVDSQTMSFIAATFTIGYPDATLDTFIATLSSQTSFTLNTGPAEDDALKGMEVIIHDCASAVQLSRAVISAYTGASKTVTLATAPTFTIAAKDNISIMRLSPLVPATAGRALVVDSSGLADANAVKVGPSGSGTVQTAGDLAATLATIAAYVDTEVAAIKAKTDNLPSDPANASDIAASFTSVASTLSAIASYIDTEVAAIKAKTDNLPAAPAATGDIPTANQNADALLDRASAIDGKTFREALRIVAAGIAGKVSGAGTGTEVFTGLDGSTTRITVTVDSSGNRTAVSY